MAHSEAVGVGGQAVFGGVLMRDSRHWAVAVRTPTGEIAVEEGVLPTWGRGLRRVPFARGLVAIAQAVPLGARALRWSAAHGLVPARRRGLTAARLAGLVTVLWFVPPLLTQRLAGGLGGWSELVVGNLLSVGLLGAYAALVGRFRMVPTLLEYHGAEHKAVAAHEAGAPLTAASAGAFSTLHPRCGTSLMLGVAAVSAVASALQLPGLVAFPLVLAGATELQLRVANRLDRPWAQAMARPGLAMQRLTTREPSAAQLEVAVAALQAVLTASAAQPSSVVTVGAPAPARA